MTASVRARAATLETMIATMVKKTTAMIFRGSAIVERVVRLGEEEIVAKRRHHAGEERRPQAEANGDGDDRREEHEVGILNADPGPEQLADADSRADGQPGENIRLGVEGLGPLGGADGLLRQRLAGNLLAGDDMHADIAARPQQIAHHRAIAATQTIASAWICR